MEYDPPSVILERIEELEGKIQEEIQELKKLLNSDL